ncbi:adhesion G-protein coupled receptor G7 [Xyrichtys novacula]|uniref:Adhesion G-protein coupled receptor G7 n=1 Tax=Xyrichtys novacula TaxID=13765 RepID=A0AAV1HQ02_XYRNO|nr:adhesion G-protein coupled receptor G7 [Xyrichtys novacula]
MDSGFWCLFTLNTPMAGLTTSTHSNSTYAPTAGPTTDPYLNTTTAPSAGPTTGPPSNFTDAPTVGPTTSPHLNTTTVQTSGPTIGPVSTSTHAPTAGPTTSLHLNTTTAPTVDPTTSTPSNFTDAPTAGPTTGPPSNSTNVPTAGPTTGPHLDTSTAQTAGPTTGPDSSSTQAPTAGPTTSPHLNTTTAPTTGPHLNTSTVPPAGSTTDPFLTTPSAGPPTTNGPTNDTTSRPPSNFTDPPTAGPTTSPDLISTDAPTAGPTTGPQSNSTTSPHLSTTTGPTAKPTTSSPSNLTDAPTGGTTTGPHLTSTHAPTAGPTTGPHLTTNTAPTTGPHLNTSTVPPAGSTTDPFLTTPSAGPPTTNGPTNDTTTRPPSNFTDPPTAGPTTSPDLISTDAPTAGPTTGPQSNSTTSPHLSTTTGPTTKPTTSSLSNLTDAPTAGPTTGPHSTSTHAPTAGPTTGPHLTTSTAPTTGPTTGPHLTITTAPPAVSSTDPFLTTAIPAPGSTTVFLNTTTPTPNSPVPTPVYNMTTAGNLTSPPSTAPPLPPTTTDHLPTTPSPSPTSTQFPPASTTTSSPPTTTPLVCNNGGEALNSVCICPDEWTGATCSQENFCREQELNGFKFPRTTVGWFAYSEETCPKGTSGEGKPQASIRCSNRNGRPDFDRPPQVLQCDQTLSDIQKNLTSPAALETLASSTQILTSRPEALTAKNVTTAAQIANTLLLSPNATESVRVAAVATVSQLLSAEAPDSTEEDNSTLGLTQTLDQLSLNLSLSLDTSQSQVVQPNLVVQSTQVPATDTQGVQFTSLSGTSGSFVADRIQVNTNTSTPVVENRFIVDALIFVQFSPVSAEAVSDHQTPSNVSLGFVLYQNDRFFRSKLYRRSRASIRVLSGSVHGRGRNVVPQHVEMMFRPRMVAGASLYDFACVFWDYSVNDWSTAGCWKGNASDGVLQCFCNHTTNFAALWSFREDYKYAKALDLISIIGLSVSIVGLVVTIVHHIFENCYRVPAGRQKNRKSQVSLLCVYLSLLTFIIIFLSGIQNSSRQSNIQPEAKINIIPPSDEHVESDVGTCTATAALLHYFLLATFMWNSLYGSELVLMIHSMRRGLPSHWTAGSLAVGWGVPAVVMAITLGVTYRVEDPLKYRQEEFCWLAALDKDKRFDFGAPMFWGFLIPVGLILIYNLVLLILVCTTTCRTNPQLKSSKSFSLKKKVMVSFSLTVILGLSWIIGYLVLVTSGHAHLVFSIIFCLCTTTQGFQIFILFTARTRAFRARLSRAVRPINIPMKHSHYSLTKHSASNTESMTESYRELWIPEDLHQFCKKES